jgi:hypothetical protein
MTLDDQSGFEAWKDRGAFDEPRLSDVVEMYKELNFEVLLVDFDPDAQTECVACMRLEPERYKTVYTRKQR